MKTYLASHLYCVALISFVFSTTFAQKPELVVQTGHSDFIESIVFSPDGEQIASGSSDGIIKLWDATSGRELRTLLWHSQERPFISIQP
jgi:WD40 repeat protein